MIVLNRLNGKAMALNPDLIERVETTPDTVVTLVDDKKFLVSESLTEVITLIADYRAAGDVAAAREASQRGLSEFPDAASLMAQRATAELDAGDRAAAEAWLALADLRQPARVRQSLLLGARLALADNEPEAAQALLQTLRRRNLRDLDALPLLMAIEAAREDPRAALAVWNAPAWGMWTTRCAVPSGPRAPRAGRRAEAKALAADLHRRYPLRPTLSPLRVVPAARLVTLCRPQTHGSSASFAAYKRRSARARRAGLHAGLSGVGKPRRDRDRDGLPSVGHGAPAHGFHDSFGDLEGTVGLGLPKQQDELFAAEAREDVLTANARANPRRDPPQHLIPGIMTVGVVDVLEVVEVEDHHGEGPVVADRPGDSCSKLEEVPLVVKARQAIPHRLVVEVPERPLRPRSAS